MIILQNVQLQNSFGLFIAFHKNKNLKKRMQKGIRQIIEKIESLSIKKPIKIISHFDTDGITSAAIFSKTLQRWKKSFSLQIVKSLDEEFIKSLPESYVLVFLDLASGSLHHLQQKNTEIIIIDHHEIPSEDVPERINILNPHLEEEEQISSSGLCYLLAKTLSQDNKDLATLAVLGMVGDVHDQNLNKYYDEIIKDSETITKRGLLLYPSTRSLDKVLEYSSFYIPQVTGSYRNIIELLREANIQKENGKYKSLHELTEEEMSGLITAIMLRSSKKDLDLTNLIGNIYLVKFHNRLEDARELSALINACSRMDYPEISLGFCLGNKSLKEKAEQLYREYRQHLVSALRYIESAEKISGKDYTIINAKEKIKDTIIGTVTSIISRSPLYNEGTIIIGLAYNQDKIKVSARISGREGRNVREVLSRVVVPLGGEVGGHPNAAGCLIEKSKENQFIQELKKILDIELVKVN